MNGQPTRCTLWTDRRMTEIAISAVCSQFGDLVRCAARSREIVTLTGHGVSALSSFAGKSAASVFEIPYYLGGIRSDAATASASDDRHSSADRAGWRGSHPSEGSSCSLRHHPQTPYCERCGTAPDSHVHALAGITPVPGTADLVSPYLLPYCGRLRPSWPKAPAFSVRWWRGRWCRRVR